MKGKTRFGMGNLILIISFAVSIVTLLSLSPILANQAFAQNQMGTSMMSPRQQWMITNNIDDITYKEGMVPMMQNIMNDPELRQQMIDQMMQRHQLMQELMQNQQFMQQFNQ